MTQPTVIGPCTLYCGDALTVLRELPDETVQCCVTSPPYWGLRDYGAESQMGLEKTPEEYVAKMVEVFREVRRVLRGDGTLWLNLGDSYATSNPVGRRDCGDGELREGRQEPEGSFSVNARKWRPGAWEKGKIDDRVQRNRNGVGAVPGLKAKDLVGIPWRLAFALQSDGWYLRQDIIWHKPNPMPESVTDRCTKAHEYIFLLTKSARYFYDAEAIKEPSETEPHAPGWSTQRPTDSGPMERRRADGTSASQWDEPDRVWGNGTRNKRSVWTVPSAPYSEAHFATFPPDLIKPCVLAGTSARGCCPKCGAPWQRVIEKKPCTMNIRVRDNAKGIIGNKSGVDGKYKASTEEIENYGPEKSGESKTTGWKPTCSCGESATIPCTVLDPFAGSGTTGMAALELGRKAILIELNPKYINLAQNRCAVTPGLMLA